MVVASAASKAGNNLAAQIAASQPGSGTGAVSPAYGGGMSAAYGGSTVGSHANALASSAIGAASALRSTPARVPSAASWVPSSASRAAAATPVAPAASMADDGPSSKPVSPFMNAKGQPYVTTTPIDIGNKSPADISYAIRDQTHVTGMQAPAFTQLESAAKAAQQAGLTRITVIAARGQGHLSHAAGTEWDVVGYNADGSMWSPAQRVAVANGARDAGANRFGLYSFGPGYLGHGTLHFGYGHPGYPANVTWGFRGYTSAGQAARAQGFPTLTQAMKSKNFVSANSFQDPAEKAFSAAVASGGKFDITGYLKNKGNVAADLAKAGVPAAQAAQMASAAPVIKNKLAAGKANAAPVLSYREDPATGAMKEDPFAAVMKAEGADAPTKVPVLKYGDGAKGRPSDQVKAYQTMLAAKGLYHGRIDGVFGPETDKATRVYQHAAGLTVDGKIGLGEGAETGPALQNDFMLSRMRPPSPGNVDTPLEATRTLQDRALASHVDEMKQMTGDRAVSPGSMLFQQAQNAANYSDPWANKQYLPPSIAKSASPTNSPALAGQTSEQYGDRPIMASQTSEGYGTMAAPPGYAEWKKTLSPDVLHYAEQRTAQMNRDLPELRPQTTDEVLQRVFREQKPSQVAGAKKVKTVPVTAPYSAQPGEAEAVATIREHNQTGAVDPFNTKTADKDQSRMSQYANDPPQVTNDSQYDALPSGTVFRDPEGNLRRKP